MVFFKISLILARKWKHMTQMSTQPFWHKQNLKTSVFWDTLMRTLALVAVGRSWRGETGLAAGVEPEWLDWRGAPEKVIACTAQSA